MMKRPHAGALLLKAAHQCGWDEDQQLAVLYSHIATTLPDCEYEQFAIATERWLEDTGLPKDLAKRNLCHLIDEMALENDCEEDFQKYIDDLLDASETEVETEKTEPKKKDEEPEPVVCVKDRHDSVNLIDIDRTIIAGSMSRKFYDSTKLWQSSDTPLEDQKIGALMARETFDLDGDLKLYLDAINAKPNLGVDVYIRDKDGKSVASHALPCFAHCDSFEIIYDGTMYRVLPPLE